MHMGKATVITSYANGTLTKSWSAHGQEDI